MNSVLSNSFSCDGKWKMKHYKSLDIYRKPNVNMVKSNLIDILT